MTGNNAAFRLSALAITAGTILGLASHAAAQSRLERAERAMAQAQRELDAARRESGQGRVVELQSDDSDDGSACSGDCDQGCGVNCDEQGARADLTTDEDD